MHRERGFTLVELMIALVIGLLVILGASQLFLVSHASFQRVELLAARQEALRFLVDSLSLDVRTADSFSEVNDVLTLGFVEGRDNDPYCSAADLSGVSYSRGAGEVKITVTCSNGVVITEPLFGSEEADGVLRVEALTFTVNSKSVATAVSFNSLDGENDASRNFEFVVTNRQAALNRD